ncbi:unnamed protein product [Umbelopsis vinacea]
MQQQQEEQEVQQQQQIEQQMEQQQMGQQMEQQQMQQMQMQMQQQQMMNPMFQPMMQGGPPPGFMIIPPGPQPQIWELGGSRVIVSEGLVVVDTSRAWENGGTFTIM